LGWNCFNGIYNVASEEARWQINSVSTSNAYAICWYNKLPYTITNLKIYNNEANYTVKNYIVYACNEYVSDVSSSTWTQLKTGTNTNTTGLSSWDISLENDNAYKYYQINCYPNNTTSLQIGEIIITAKIKI